VADRRAVPWIAESLKDGDAGVQVWCAGVLDQLLWSDLIQPNEGEDLLKSTERNENEAVRETAAFIRGSLKQREESGRAAAGIVRL